MSVRFLLLTSAACVLPMVPVAAQVPAFVSSPSPSVVIEATGSDGSVRFATATWAARLPDGRIAIVDAVDGALRIADSTGRMARSWGGIGDAPGEFRSASWVGACGGDSLYVWDMRATRMSVLHPQTGYVRSFSAPASIGTTTASCDRLGNVALFATVAPRRGATVESVQRTTADGRRYEIGTVDATIALLDRSGKPLLSLPGVPFGEMIMGQLGRGGGMGAMPRPLGALTTFAVHDGNLVVARTDSAAVRWYRADSEVAGSYRLPIVPGAPNEAQYSTSAERAVEVAPAGLQPNLVAFALQVPRPTTHRPFSRMLVGSNGLLWFVTSLPGDPVTRLRAHDRSGTIVGILDIKRELEVFELGADYILGRTENADGEQQVVLYRFRRQ